MKIIKITLIVLAIFFGLTAIGVFMYMAWTNVLYGRMTEPKLDSFIALALANGMFCFIFSVLAFIGMEKTKFN